MVEHGEVIGLNGWLNHDQVGIVWPDGGTNVRRGAEKWKIINNFF